MRGEKTTVGVARDSMRRGEALCAAAVDHVGSLRLAVDRSITWNRPDDHAFTRALSVAD